jgi:hypothetical protein
MGIDDLLDQIEPLGAFRHEIPPKSEENIRISTTGLFCEGPLWVVRRPQFNPIKVFSNG